eukprot:TRINITY_DN40172_c0_g1_i1.p1 TRINITY_DN40172_c0_g1~~TRINITY_DN40172_c0_g1_i1.p1  ORF type:complete len:188 (+),score=12.07 TRINITY_DN40172_c0_g1_i1:73-636(+)
MDAYTFNVRHIPCKIVEADIKRAMDTLGLDSSRYDVSLPVSKPRPGKAQRAGNFGYGFVVCHGREDAEAFLNVFQGYQFQDVNSSKRILVELSSSKRTLASCRLKNSPEPMHPLAVDQVLATAPADDERRSHDGRQFFESAPASSGSVPRLRSANGTCHNVEGLNFDGQPVGPPAACDLPATRWCNP